VTDVQMLALIQAIHRELKGAYGSPRMVRELRDRGFPASKERVERLMRENSYFAERDRWRNAAWIGVNLTSIGHARRRV
jgi:hypothetical protein